MHTPKNAPDEAEIGTVEWDRLVGSVGCTTRLIVETNVNSVDHTGHPSDDRQNDTQQKVNIATSSNQHCDRLKTPSVIPAAIARFLSPHTLTPSPQPKYL